MPLKINGQALVPADFAVGTSITAAGWSWLAPVNEILTPVATLVAIVSGIYAIRYYIRKTKELDE